MADVEQGLVVGIRTVAIPVSDQDAALGFYTDALGLELQVDEPVPQIGGRWIELTAPGAATSIALAPAGQELPAGVDTGIRLVTPDAEALHRSLGERGTTVGELLRWPGVPVMFEFEDPDGNTLYAVE